MSNDVTLIDGKVHFSCKHCQQEMRVPEDYIGKPGKCQRCKEPLVVPGPLKSDEIRFDCPICQESMLVAKTLRGRTTTCLTCNQLVTVPGGGKKGQSEKDPDADTIIDTFSSLLCILGWIAFFLVFEFAVS